MVTYFFEQGLNYIKIRCLQNTLSLWSLLRDTAEHKKSRGVSSAMDLYDRYWNAVLHKRLNIVL